MNAEQLQLLEDMAMTHGKACRAIEAALRRIEELEARETETRKLVVMLAEVPSEPHYAIDHLCEMFGITKP